jgi:hypothetical protein
MSHPTQTQARYIYNSRLELEEKVAEVWFKVNKMRDKLTKTEIVRIIRRELGLFTFDFVGVAEFTFTEYTDLRKVWVVAGIALVNVGDIITPHLILFRFRDDEGLEYLKMADIKVIGTLHVSERE